MNMTNNKPALFLFLSVLLPGFLPAAQAAELTAIEQEITKTVTEQASRQLSLLEQLVDINSGTDNKAGIHQVGEQLRTELKQLGFSTQWVNPPASMKRAGSLVATRQGSKGKKILLIGHLDTVFSANNPFQQFVRHNNELATGPGVIDNKGGDVVMLYALKALHKAHALDDATITIVLSGDEEDAGKPVATSRKSLIDAAKQSDVALDFEWSLSADTATIARRGVSGWLLKTSGKDAHSSEIFQNSGGYGAIFEINRILNDMRNELSTEAYLSFNPGLILGGDKTKFDSIQGTASGRKNIIAKVAIAEGDLRFISDQQRAKAEQRITAIVNNHLPETTASIQFEEGIPAMPPTAKNQELLNLYSQISNDLGYGPVKPLDPGLRGAGDISYVASLVDASLAGLGPIGTGAHSVKEKLQVSSLTMQTQRAALLIYRLIN
ncbi:carboxypeptidase G2 [Legionella spiritensis]|nr:carboxypeptidase G2 [Legionella spiritensis]